MSIVAACVCLAACGGETDSNTPNEIAAEQVRPAEESAAPAAPGTTAETPPAANAGEAGAGFVGSGACADCHPEQSRLWTGSHHDLAMQPATEATILGDFDDVSLGHHGLISRFFERDGKFYVRTDGPDGELADFQVLYAFGVFPLQQYLVSIGNGHIQALPFAWDARPAAEGGKRWYHLYPDDPLPPDDVLHWTNADQNWNFMCAQCHSTNLQKNYDPETRSYDTTWSEIDVACEACHGPASEHVRWAAAEESERAEYDGENPGLQVRLRKTEDRSWVFAEGARIAHLEGGANESSAELETCAPCHSRRSLIDERFPYGGPLLDAYRLSHLVEPLYFVDGQIDDEVYVYGSFLQSKMHSAGVICSDCHDAHALRIESPEATCLRCHATSAFSEPSHHHHEPGPRAPGCVDCHMPARTYMGVDVRRDHSFRVPRPDLSVDLDVPNPCAACHPEQTAEWAAEQVVGWFPEGQTSQGSHFARALAAAREGDPAAAQELAELVKDESVPAIVRATAVEAAAPLPRPAVVSALRAAVADPDPLVRRAAAEAAENIPEQYRGPLLLPLLSDPVRAVRITAARTLATVSPQTLPDGARRLIDQGLDEYEQSEMANAERAGARTNLGMLAAMRGRREEAAAQFEEAVALDPFYVPAYVNRADVLRALRRDEEGEQVLRAGIEKVPGDASLHHALGLLLHRTGRPGAALDEFALAADADASPSRYAYVYALALADAGDPDRALFYLHKAHRSAPHDPEILFALANSYRDRGETRTALEYAKKLHAEVPGAPAVKRLLDELEGRPVDTMPPGHPPVPGAAVH
jgi:tetratricopeptide (TPR) repeat protein